MTTSSMAKRKRSSATCNDPGTRSKRPKLEHEKSKHVHTPPRCIFLELPIEIRYLIFEMVLRQYPVFLHPRFRGRLVTGSTLLGANQQIRHEMLTEIYANAAISAVVVDFDFRHIGSWLNSLTDVERRRLPRDVYDGEKKQVVRHGRQVTVELVLNPLSRVEQARICSNALDRAPKLEKWIRRIGRQKKSRAVTPDFHYTVSCVDPDKHRRLVMLRHWGCYLEDLRANYYRRPSRQRTELTAIKVAVLEENKATLEDILNALQV